MDNLYTSIHMYSILMTILIVHLEKSKKDYQNPQENFNPWKKEKRVFLSMVYIRYTSEFLVCGQYMTFLVHNWYMKITKMTKIENSGIQPVFWKFIMSAVYDQKSHMN